MKSNKYQNGFLIIIITFTLDYVSKVLVEANLPFHEMVELIPYLAFYRSWNEGIAFSFLSGVGALGLVIMAIIVVAFVCFLWVKTPKEQHWASTGYALVIGGALGNLVDRFQYGHVVDFILFHTQTWSFAVFNLADCFISIGAAIIILDELLRSFGPSSRNSGSDAAKE